MPVSEKPRKQRLTRSNYQTASKYLTVLDFALMEASDAVKRLPPEEGVKLINALADRVAFETGWIASHARGMTREKFLERMSATYDRVLAEREKRAAPKEPAKE